ncbi:MAG: Fur family transcriptional regulator [Gemmatimonadales bacterium]
MKVDARKHLDHFRHHLRDHNLPVTHQRLAVADVVFTAEAHLSVDEIERALKRRGVRVGTATVYRTLDVLKQGGLIREHDFGEGFKRYEPASGQEQHQHLICAGCGKVMEFANERLERMVALVAEEVEFRPHHHRLEIHGLCRECQQANPLARTR